MQKGILDILTDHLEKKLDKYEDLAAGSNFDGYHQEEIKYLAMSEAYEDMVSFVNRLKKEQPLVPIGRPARLVDNLVDKLKVRCDEHKTFLEHLPSEWHENDEWKEDEAKYRGMIEAYQDALETIDCLVRKESSPILVGLPCNPGDKVYADSHCFGVLEYTVENFVISSDGLTIQCAAHSQSVGDYASECLDEIEADISEFGKTIFLTMEDAVKASSNIYNTNSEVEEEYEKD